MEFADPQASREVVWTYPACVLYRIYARRQRIDEWVPQREGQILGSEFTWKSTGTVDGFSVDVELCAYCSFLTLFIDKAKENFRLAFIPLGFSLVDGFSPVPATLYEYGTSKVVFVS